jgi:hypothetical protein
MLSKIGTLIEKVLSKAKRPLELKGAPMIVFESGDKLVWILDNGEVCVATWDGQESVIADDATALRVLKSAVFEYALKTNYDALVRGKKE